ncbi:hypothetical protein CKAH01_14913 [Colletotrichum kahawae]|uniref:Uncharacterized protein n=1 Tax=Colletotrichum kahawae TaxID=34407 RepID=A0AAD9YIP5_COLKA|nr:hypothetical protein CKAH01_14913 [Colletotrichum kahawae]
MTTAQGYSTLEWNPHQPRDEPAGIELDHGQRASRWDDEGRYLQPDRNKHDIYQGERHELSDGQAPDPDTDNINCGKGRKFFGFSKRIFVTALAIGLLLIIGAIVGGIAGGLHKRQNATDKAATRSILQATRLAAANRTILESIQHTVVFQDSNGALLARYRITPSSRQWKTVNLTLKFSSMIEEEKIELPAGAPLVATACADWACGDTMVVYLGTDNVLHSIRDNALHGSADWYPFTDVAKANNLYASNNSQLAMALSKSFHD